MDIGEYREKIKKKTINDNIAYTIKTLAIEFNRSIDEVKTAFKVLKRLEMIEFAEDKGFKIKNWEKHQNVEGLERLRNQNNQRVAKHRAKKKENKGKNEEEANNEETNDKVNLVDGDGGNIIEGAFFVVVKGDFTLVINGSEDIFEEPINTDTIVITTD